MARRSRMAKRVIKFAEPADIPEHITEMCRQYENDIAELGFTFSHCTMIEDIFFVKTAKQNWSYHYVNQDQECYLCLSVKRLSDSNNPWYIDFTAYFSDGTQLITLNHGLNSNLLVDIPQAIMQDVFNKGLTEQYRIHQDKLNELLKEKEIIRLEPKDCLAFENQILEVFMENLVAKGKIKPDNNGEYRLTFGTALSDTRKGLVAILKQQFAKKKDDPAATSASKTIPLAVDLDAFNTHMQAKKPRQSSMISKIMVLAISLILFIVAFQIRFSLNIILILVIVLFIHELGHYLGMYLFGYKDLRIVFLPFLGAATIGEPGEVSVFKRFLVYILGPAPGLVIGTVFVCLSYETDQEWMYKFGLFTLILNYLNLLPFVPLDGGRICEMLLFFRYPRLQSIFNYISAAAFLLGGILLHDPILGFIAVFWFLAARSLQVNNRATLRLREILATEAAQIETETIKQIIFGMLREAPFGKLPIQRKCQAAQHLMESITQRPAKRGVILACMLIYVFLFILPAFIAIPFIIINGVFHSGI